MDLARAAAARTLADWSEPQQPPTAEPELVHPPAPPANPTRSANTTRSSTTRATTKPTDPAVLFTRLAAVVRDCIALEARLAAGGSPRAPNRRPESHACSDSRREPLLEAFRFVTANIPGRAATMRDITARLDEELAADPDQAYGSADFLACICEDFGIEIDYTKLPDEYLFYPIDPPYDDDDASDPRATSPP